MIFRISSTFLACLAASIAVAQDAEPRATPRFGGPNTVENQIESDFGDTWAAWKQNLADEWGLTVNVDYTAALLTANETFDDKSASGGIARLFGTYDLFNVENGTLVWKFEHRHAYGSLSPFDFSLGQIGYVGLQLPPFNDTEFRTQNLYWRQRMNGGRSTLIAGVLDVTDYLDAFALASPWLHFLNFAFSTGSAAIGLPNDGAVGIAYGTMVTDNFYVIAGITDSNGDPSSPFEDSRISSVIRNTSPAWNWGIRLRRRDSSSTTTTSRSGTRMNRSNWVFRWLGRGVFSVAIPE